MKKLMLILLIPIMVCSAEKNDRLLITQAQPGYTIRYSNTDVNGNTIFVGFEALKNGFIIADHQSKDNDAWRSFDGQSWKKISNNDHKIMFQWLEKRYLETHPEEK